MAMKNRWFSLFVLSLVVGTALLEPAQAASRGKAPKLEIPPATFATTGEATRIPHGWVDFCTRRPEECRVSDMQAVDVVLTKTVWRVVDQINRGVNGSIIPISNLDHWGTIIDHWDYPVDGMGDCKIYALYKRKLLMQAGFPRQALLMTIVRDLHGKGHAILTVKTDHGDYILDNLSNDVRPWNVTGYGYIMRQSQENPNVWVSVEPDAIGALDARQSVGTVQ